MCVITDWGTIVIVEHAGALPTPELLNDLMEALVDEAGITVGTDGAVTVRLFVTAPDRAGALKEAQRVVLRALQTIGIPHEPSTIRFLALDPMADFQRDFPGPK